MRSTLLLSAMAWFVFASVRPVDAQVSGSFNVLLKVSADPSVGGTAIGVASGTVDGVPVSIDDLSWTDTHSSRSPLFEGGVAFRTGGFAEILGLFSYGHAGAKSDIIGELNGVPVSASFDDYEFWGLEGGIRVRQTSGVGPYASITGGFRRVSEIQARLQVDSTFQTVTGYEASTVPSFAVGGGVLWGLDEFALGFEVALRYAGSPSVPAARAVQPASDAGARWSLPVGLVFRF